MNDWPVRPLRALADVALGRQRAPQHEQGPHLVPYLRAANVTDGQLNLDDVKEMNFAPREQLVFALRPGDVLVTEGSGSLSTVGASAVWQGEISGTVCFQNTLLRLRPKDGRTDPRFLAWWSRATFGDGVYASIASGANIFHVSADRVRALPLHCPPLDEQRRIADFLDAETTRIDQLAALQATALGKLEERNRAVRDSLIDALVERVGELPFRRFVSKIEQGTSPQCENHPRESGKWGVLKLSAVKGGRFYTEENKQLPGDVTPAREYEVRDGDLLISRANTPELVGDVAVANGTGSRLLLPDLIYRVELNREMKADFAAQVLLSTRVRRLIQATARGSSQSMVKLRGEDIREWPIPRANARQQEELVSAVREHTDSSDRLRLVITRQLALLAERRQALITAAVTGGISV